MYGVPADLPIQRFVGDALFQARIGMDGVHFAFGREGVICAYGLWQLHDSGGTLIDQTQEHSDRECYRVHVILNADVTSCSIDAPRSFSLSTSRTFAPGESVKIQLYARNVPALEFRVYKVRDAQNFFAGLKDIHSFGVKSSTNVGSWIRTSIMKSLVALFRERLCFSKSNSFI